MLDIDAEFYRTDGTTVVDLILLSRHVSTVVAAPKHPDCGYLWRAVIWYNL